MIRFIDSGSIVPQLEQDSFRIILDRSTVIKGSSNGVMLHTKKGSTERIMAREQMRQINEVPNY